MTLQELTPRQRKILRLIVNNFLDIGYLVKDGLTYEEAREVLNDAHMKIAEAKIASATEV